MTFHSQASMASSLSACPSTGNDAPDAHFVLDILALHPALLAFARRLSKQDCDAEDLVQDTIVRALAGQHLFQEGTNLKAWLFTICATASTRAGAERSGRW